MTLKRSLTFIVALLVTQLAGAQMKQDIANYIAKYKDIALTEMVRCKIPASITLAQGLHESSYGKSKLSTEANNHFGIKCKEEWDGKKFYQNDDAPNECFRVYDHAEDSYIDHSDFLVTRTRYASLFELPTTDYKAWAHGLKTSGYATNPKYADILIKTIEDYNLTAFDQEGLAMIAEKERLMNPVMMAEQPTLVMNKAEKRKEKEEVKKERVEAARTETVPTPTVVFAATNEPAPSSPKEVRKTVITKSVTNVFATTNNTEALKKEFVVNGTKAIKATGVTDPLAVAYNYQIQYAQILAFNDMNEGDKFKDGENIFLQSKRQRGADEKYIVQSGESMRDVAQKTGVKLRELYQKNMMALTLNEQVPAGETLYLQEKRNSAPRTIAYSDYLKTLNTNIGSTISGNTSSANASTDNIVPKLGNSYTNSVQYTVSPSDTLYSIAKKFNTTVAELRALNKLEGASLHPGQTLVVGK